MRKILTLAILLLAVTGCVSMRTYRDTKSELLSLKYGSQGWQSQIADLNARNESLQMELSRLQNARPSSSTIANEKRIAELEAALAERDSVLNKLRAELTTAVGHLQGRGLTLVERNGKFYVLMEDKLMFETGKYDITKEGRDAILDIGRVLAKTPNVDIIVEGHTDNKGFRERKDAEIVDNWDLSCKRATEVTRLLNTTKGLKPSRLTASGRGQYMPIASNNSESGRAQNRRTEIVLTPQLDKLIEILKSR